MTIFFFQLSFLCQRDFHLVYSLFDKIFPLNLRIFHFLSWELMLCGRLYSCLLSSIKYLKENCKNQFLHTNFLLCHVALIFHIHFQVQFYCHMCVEILQYQSELDYWFGLHCLFLWLSLNQDCYPSHLLHNQSLSLDCAENWPCIFNTINNLHILYIMKTRFVEFIKWNVIF